MRKHVIVAICGLMAVCAAGTSAKQGVASLVPRVQSLKFAEPWRPNRGNGATRVIGSVIDVRLVPVAGARVQLRNLTTGAIDLTSESDANGEYEFAMETSGSYVVEMVRVDGYLVSLSNAGTVARFETLQTVIQLPGRWDAVVKNLVAQRNFTGFMGKLPSRHMSKRDCDLQRHCPRARRAARI